MTDINDIVTNIKNSANVLVQNTNNNILGPWDNGFVRNICSNINELAFDVRNKNEHLYNDLQNIKSNLFLQNNFVNMFTLGRLIQIMRSYEYLSTNDFWKYAHPKVVQLSKNKFEDGYYDDAVQTAIIEMCTIVRNFRMQEGLPEIPSDKDMMYNTFKTLLFTDSSNISLKNIQEGYEKIFPGVVQAVRNPNAHENNKIEKADAVCKLMMVSDLMRMLDKALENHSNKTLIE